MQGTNTKLERCYRIIEETYPNMQKLTIAEFEEISKEIESGNMEALDTLYTHLLPAMRYSARVFSRTNLDVALFNDFLEETIIALMELCSRRANSKWIPNYNTFASHSHRAVDQALKSFMENNATKKQIGHGKRKKSIKIERYEDIPETLPDDSSQIFEQIAKDVLNDLIFEVLDKLTSREKTALSLWFGLENDKPLTMQEIGKEFGVSRETIRKILEKGLRKMRFPWNSKRLREFYEL